jgi:hypothetical protein
MDELTSTPRRDCRLEALLLLYVAASLLHFTHNAEFVQEYPNLPAWITRFSVYSTWVAITGIGLLGYLLYRYGPRVPGFALLCVYAAMGLDGLLHYTLAPADAHSRSMNFTIWFEVVVASVLLLCLAVEARKLTSR